MASQKVRQPPLKIKNAPEKILQNPKSRIIYDLF